MSTCLECEFIEVNPGEWYYLLEKHSAPRVSWDWREFAVAYGPFSSFEEALKDLRLCHANPGGYYIMDNEEFPGMDEVLERLIEECHKRYELQRKGLQWKR